MQAAGKGIDCRNHKASAGHCSYVRCSSRTAVILILSAGGRLPLQVYLRRGYGEFQYVPMAVGTAANIDLLLGVLTKYILVRPNAYMSWNRKPSHRRGAARRALALHHALAEPSSSLCASLSSAISSRPCRCISYAISLPDFYFAMDTYHGRAPDGPDHLPDLGEQLTGFIRPTGVLDSGKRLFYLSSARKP